MRHFNVFLFILIFVFNCANCEWFSSIGQMEDLIHEETDLLYSLREYITAQEGKIQKIKKLADEYQEISDNARSNIDKYLGHPINQYRLVKRLALEWSDMEKLVTQDVSREFLSKLSSKREYFPNDKDILGSSQAIIRLQDTYKLDTHQIAQGIVKDIKAIQPLTAEDCFHIGRTASNVKDFYHCVLWMNEVLAMDEQSYRSFSRFDLLDHLSYCLDQQGDIERAFNITNEMLKINSSSDRLHDDLLIYGNLLENSSKLAAYKENRRGERLLSEKPDFVKQYMELCSNSNITIPVEVERKLKCYLWTNKKHPRLILQPVRLEELWHSPHLVRFHDIITDDEINQIKAIAKPKLHRSEVYSDSGDAEHAPHRVSKSSWLNDQMNPLVAMLTRRISDITGLSLESAEPLQVANYGIGGQNGPHVDYLQVSSTPNVLRLFGNRVATFMIYLSEVTHGGSTVFLQPGIGIKPIKGTAAFWYNLFSSGVEDERTVHAACPVLTGVKWVANQWIHERGQEFINKCNLVQSSDNRLF